MREPDPTPPHDVVFLLDVDNTLLDNDQIERDLERHLTAVFGAERQARYWEIFEALRAELGYADYLGALQRYRVEHLRDPQLLAVSLFLIDYPFAERLYPGALEVIERLRARGPTVILSDGDVVFQPRKIERSGLWEAVGGNVLIYIHKEQMLDDVEARYPARHYVMVGDKLRILAAMKGVWADRLTTVFVRQGHYARDPRILASYPPADVTIERIGDLLARDLSTLVGMAEPRRFQPAAGVQPAAGGTPTQGNANARHGGARMKATQQLHELGQSLWLDNITRDLLEGGTLRRYRDEYSITGVTSNPTIFDHAIMNTTLYDDFIRERTRAGESAEALFVDLALDDLTRAADLFRPIYDATGGVDGWVSMEVSPLLADDAWGSVARARWLHARAARPNLFVKIPGTGPGLIAIEEAIFAGTPINVTLLFSREHYLAAADAYLRGIERRIAAGLDPVVPSVASVFVSRWDKAVLGKVPEALRDKLGIAIAKRTYKAYRDLLGSPRWQELANAGARAQRLLWASTGTKDPEASDVLYVTALAAPDTIITLPGATLLAFADHGEVKGTLPADGGDAEEMLARFVQAGVDLDALASQLQREGVGAFAASWRDLMDRIAAKGATLTRAA